MARRASTTESDRRIALPIRTLRLSFGHILSVDFCLSRRDVVAVDGAFEDGEGGQGLIVGDFVAGVVDAGKGEGAGLFGLAVDEGVGGADVDVARGAGVEGFVDGFAAEPVAWFADLF